MARRVSWTNNSSGHSGTYVYRAATIDPQNLPAPVATVDPVAQGATAEWVDNSGEYGCFAVQDFDGQGVSAISSEVCITDPLANAQVGDYVEGGVYGGTITYADNRQYHLVFAKQDGEGANLSWGTQTVGESLTGANDPDDGKANQDLILANYTDPDYEAFYHCRDYTDAEGNNDYYLAALNEFDKAVALAAAGHPEFSTTIGYHRTSTEANLSKAWCVFLDYSNASNNGITTDGLNKSGDYTVRPVRRIPA